MEKVKANANRVPPVADGEQKVVYADTDPVELPENAFRELGADEHYRPFRNHGFGAVCDFQCRRCLSRP